MAITEIKRTHTAKKPDENFIPDPNIVSIAKLAVLLADRSVDTETKLAMVRISKSLGRITEEEATQLLLYRGALEKMLYHEYED